MHPADIKAELTKRGYTQGRVASLVDVTQPFVSHVIYGRIRNRAIAAAIAAAIGRPLTEIWPGVYDRVIRPGRPRAAA